MDLIQFEELINYLVDQGVQAMKNNTEETDFQIDYVGIFTKSDEEFEDMMKLTQKLGDKIDIGTAKTGTTFKLAKTIKTNAGPVEYVKIRKPDPTRPQRGGPDFKINNYNKFKEKYLQKSGNFTLMIRKDYEMIELKGVDVLVYLPSKITDSRSAED